MKDKNDIDYLLIGKFLILFNTIEQKVKEEFCEYFERQKEEDFNHKYISSIQTLIFLIDKSDVYSFKNFEITSKQINIFDVNSAVNKLKLNHIIALSENKLVKSNNLNKFELLNYSIFDKNKPISKVDILNAFKLLLKLRNIIAHEENRQFYGRISNLGIENTIVKSYIPEENNSHENQDVMTCNIYWMEKIIIPFLEKYSEEKNKSKYDINTFEFELRN